MFDVKEIIEIARRAGQRVMHIYKQPFFEVTIKSDNSSLTAADLESHSYICQSLKKLYPYIPIVSEESVATDDEEMRKTWDYFFLVDPLDGTKEFIKRNDEFTINIALIKKDQPVLGVIYAPALDVMYYAEENQGAYKIINNLPTKLPLHREKKQEIRAIISRSHHCAKTEKFLAVLQSQDKPVKVISAGSALKFGLIAEGSADIYPRFAPTMEWDTAAGHIIVKESGKQLNQVNGHPLQYNKAGWMNPNFIVQ